MPIWYTELKSFHLSNDITMSICKKPVSSIQAGESILLDDKKWLQDPSNSSWVVFHFKSREHFVCYDTSAAFSIRRDDCKSPATIKHLINVLILAIKFLNLGQATIGFDQPFHATAKRIQWNQAALYGKRNW